MRKRCLDRNHENYPLYGGRGITICARWESFESFLADMGERPDGTTLDRFPDRDGNYEPGNCRWATPVEQAHNREQTKLTVDIVNEIRGRYEHGEPQTSIARRLGIPAGNVQNVIARRSWKHVA
jgi:hypothetical protein